MKTRRTRTWKSAETIAAERFERECAAKAVTWACMTLRMLGCAIESIGDDAAPAWDVVTAEERVLAVGWRELARVAKEELQRSRRTACCA
jgi:hypothetical protein